MIYIMELNEQQEHELLETLYKFVVEVASNHKEASPAELQALPEICQLIADHFIARC